MQPSIVGLGICLALALAGYHVRGTLIVSLIASLAFGATAFATLTALGGSSPLIYVCFSGALVASVAFRRHAAREVGNVLGAAPANLVLLLLMVYAVTGALLFPRLFAGRTSAFVISAAREGIVEAPLAPTSGNITQSGYFALSILASIALSIMLLHSNRLTQVRQGFFLWAILHTGFGLVDFVAKTVGIGDVLEPIRTANYAMLTDVGIAGFARISGSYSEASSFAASSLACLAFAYTYWARTKDRLAMGLTLVLLLLLLLSTSSTAYAGLAILSLALCLLIGRSVLSDRLKPSDAAVMALLILALFAMLAVMLYNPRLFDPFVEMINATVINKSDSASGRERSYWNTKSLQAFVDTAGLGVGLGSSRASSWLVAVLSQLGLLGSLMMALLVVFVARGLGRYEAYADAPTQAIVAAVRAGALASLVGGMIIGGAADPGLQFFVAFAVITATRARIRIAVSRGRLRSGGGVLPVDPEPRHPRLA